MNVNSDLKNACLEVKDSSVIAGPKARAIYGSNGDVIRYHDGTRWKNSSDLEARTSAQLASDAKYEGATRYNSNTKSLVVWDGTDWVSAKAGDFLQRTSAQLATEVLASGRVFFNTDTDRLVFCDGSAWLTIETSSEQFVNVTGSGSISLSGINKDVRILITGSSALTIADATVFSHDIYIKNISPTLALLTVAGHTIDGSGSSRTLHQYQTIKLTRSPLNATEMLLW